MAKNKISSPMTPAYAPPKVGSTLGLPVEANPSARISQHNVCHPQGGRAPIETPLKKTFPGTHGVAGRNK